MHFPCFASALIKSDKRQGVNVSIVGLIKNKLLFFTIHASNYFFFEYTMYERLEMFLFRYENNFKGFLKSAVTTKILGVK